MKQNMMKGGREAGPGAPVACSAVCTAAPGAATVGSDHAWMIVTGWGSSGVRGAAPRDFCPPQAPKKLGKPLRMYENTPSFTYLEHCHCRFRRRRLTFHNRISCSSSHSFRNPLYEVHVLGLVNNQTEE